MQISTSSNLTSDACSSETVADRLFRLIGEAIVAGEFASGTKVNEPELAARFGTSRAPLREAIRRLEERKLLTAVPRQGARVTVLTGDKIREIYLVREALEAAAVREAAYRMSKADIASLHDLLALHTQRVEAGDAYLQGVADDDFHFRIIRASGNATLASLLLDEYYLLIRMIRRRLPQSGEHARRALVEHRRIADALAGGDADLAELLMRRHISVARKRIEDLSSNCSEPR